MYRCFVEGFEEEMLDRKGFRFKHKLLSHPALSLENLASVIPALPQDRVYFSKGLLETGADFEATYRTKPRDRTIGEIIEDIRVTDSYVMVRSPEVHESFRELHRDLINDVEALMRKRGMTTAAIDPQLYLFIASPNSITPFHLDRYSTFLLQFRGSKTVSIFPQWNKRVVPEADLEDYMAYSSTKLHWEQSMNALGEHHDFQPGDALHIPFAAGHHVKNGPGDVSISMSIIFNTEESVIWRQALQFNQAARRYLDRFGFEPHPVGSGLRRDALKSGLWRVVSKVRRAVRT
jgi:hypothetical protein